MNFDSILNDILTNLCCWRMAPCDFRRRICNRRNLYKSKEAEATSNNPSGYCFRTNPTTPRTNP